MTNQSIRERARAIWSSTDGLVGIFLVPVLLGLLVELVNHLLNSIFLVSKFPYFYQQIPIYNDGTHFQHLTLDFGIEYTFLFQFLVELLFLVALFQVLQRVREITRQLSYKESFRILFGPRFVPIVLATMVKEFCLYLASLPLIVGLVTGLGLILTPNLYFLSYGILPDFSPLVTTSVGLISLGLLVFGILLYLYVDLSLKPMYFLLYDQLEAGVFQNPFKLMKQSWQLMKGHRMRLFLLDLSFFFWWIGILLTFGLLAIYVMPYYWTCQALFYEDRKGQSADLYQTFFLTATK
ncbi:DUF975 family protein [Streptococcus suis]|nr:DUF975 family protein [Streptococcus suis]